MPIPQQQQQKMSRELKVEDALLYLDQVGIPMFKFCILFKVYNMLVHVFAGQNGVFGQATNLQRVS